MISNTENFIEKANRVHSNIYNYSLVKYIKASEKVKIICPKHGVFQQTPHNHLAGNRCPKCFGGVKYDQNYFIDKSKIVHKNKYDYSLVNYENWDKKIKIICPEHGIFEQTPNNHLMNHGCPKCYFDSKRVTFKDLIEKCNKVHNNKYTYNKINFDKIKIFCPKHGEFEQNIQIHLKGGGCKLCFNDKYKLQKLDFIERSNKVHNYLFDYSLVDYVNNYTIVKIICSEHGIFEQTPKNHMAGVRCQFCREELRSQIPLFIKYSQKVNNITRQYKKILLSNWNGFDFYDNEYIKENYNLNCNNKNYPTIDHKTSKSYGFLNDISPNIIGNINNLCITKRFINSNKNSKNCEEFQKIIKNYDRFIKSF